MWNKITTFVRAHWRDKTIRNATIAVEVAASAKNISISVYRTLAAVNPQLAATLFTFAATFCSIIIEAGKQQIELCPTATHENQSGNQVVSEDTANQLSPTEIPSIAYSCTCFCSLRYCREKM